MRKRNKNRVGILAMVLTFGMAVSVYVSADTIHGGVSEHILAPEYFRPVREAVRTAPAGMLEGVGIAEVYDGNVSMARAVAYTRAVMAISRQLRPFGVDALAGEMIQDIFRGSSERDHETGTENYDIFLQAPFDAILASSFIVEEGFYDSWYRVVARLAYNDPRTQSTPSTLTQSSRVSYIPGFVLNARMHSPENMVIGVGVARMAAVNESRLVAQVRAILDIFHQTEGAIMQSTETLFISINNETFYFSSISHIPAWAFDNVESRGIRVIDEGITTAGDYWVVVGFTSNSFRQMPPTRSAQAPGSSAGGAPQFVQNAVISLSNEGAFVGVGVAKKATLNMSRTAARIDAMTDISRQIESIVYPDEESMFARTYNRMPSEGLFIVDEDFVDGYYWVVVAFSYAWIRGGRARSMDSALDRLFRYYLYERD